MRYSVATLLAFAASALAQTAGFDVLTEPTTGESVPAGKTFTIEWEPSTTHTGTVTLSLLGGSSPSTLQVLGSIAAGVQSSAGKYEWAVNSTLGSDATYGIKLSLDSDDSIFQYSFPFVIAASASSSTTAAAGSSSAAAAASTTSAASTTAAATAATSESSSAVSSAVSVESSSAAAVESSAAAVESSTAVSVVSAASSAAATTFTTKTGNATATGKTSTATSTATKTGSGSSATSSSATVVTNAAGSVNFAGSLAAIAGFIAIYAAL